MWQTRARFVAAFAMLSATALMGAGGGNDELSGEVHGVVLEADDRTPISNAWVLAFREGRHWQDRTNGQGEYRVIVDGNGPLERVQYHKSGYRPVELQNLSSSRSHIVNVVLETVDDPITMQDAIGAWATFRSLHVLSQGGRLLLPIVDQEVRRGLRATLMAAEAEAGWQEYSAAFIELGELWGEEIGWWP